MQIEPNIPKQPQQPPSVEQQKAMLQQWQAAAALQEIKHPELKAMTDDDVRQAIAWVLADTVHQYKDPKYDTYSGLIEQQRYFMKWREKELLSKKSAGNHE